ncbi:DNA internalization-related competence protein ComEC/Rec2 [Marinobacter nanhaiticus]|uniref:DNA internalization-related competence protein ComEC/Rec2 n=1 Tax=Marinobacter nanhaiticus TaxID=1305740 RepID=UPI00039D904F|nr:DNA internalization-related competence protein ComEC/Rec2 [Marinobacter nanhaiticus]
MRAGIAAFAGGVILLYCVGRILPLPLLWIILIGIGSVPLLNQRFRYPAFALCCLLGGLLWASWSASERLLVQLPATSDSSVRAVAGYRCSLVSPGAYDSLRFDFCITRWLDTKSSVTSQRHTMPTPSQGLPTRLRLALYGADKKLDLPLRLHMRVRLKPPHGSINPQGFRYETWLFRHGFGATGSVQEWQAAPDVECGLHCYFHQWREQVARSLGKAYGKLDAYPMMEALLLGERRYLDADDWAVFRATGTSHLIAISGLHIGLVGLFSGWLASRLLARVPRGVLMSRGRRRGVVVVSLSACLCYALLAGFTVPTQRALVMAAVAAAVYLRSRLSGYWTAWLVALGCVLALDPFAPLDGGFWLSFGAVACLILLFSGRLDAPGPVKTLLQAQAAATAGLLPVLMGLGLPAAAMGWMVNLLAIPLMSFLLLPLLFVLTPLGLISDPLLHIVAPILDAVLSGFLQGLAWFARVSPEGFRMGMAEAAVLAAAVIACLFPVGRMTRWALASVSIAVLVGQWGLKSGNATVSHPELWVWDVGQGLSVLYREGDQVLVYDTGPGSPSGYSAVDSVLRPNLRGLGVEFINTLLISHGDADHASGLGSLLDHMKVGQLVTGEPTRLPAVRAQGIGFDPCRAGTLDSAGAIRMELWQAPGAGAGNSRSCVLRIFKGDVEIVLPGDITGDEERLWLADHRLEQDVYRILVAPHHGSKTSSSENWVTALAPDVVIFSAGYRHPYGHPADVVQSRYRVAGAALYNTATSGAVHVELLGEGVRVSPTRADAPFWITPPPG